MKSTANLGKQGASIKHNGPSLFITIVIAIAILRGETMGIE